MKKSKQGHFSVQQGKKVILLFKNGDKTIVKYKEKKGNCIITSEGERIPTKLLRTISIYKYGKSRKENKTIYS